ncbi:hypothetical protein XENTR_v10014899 [Xenopus tropicalis]|nr:hypothetical protein XENTR_v10014899 [Xenopus tropicalis]
MKLLHLALLICFGMDLLMSIQGLEGEVIRGPVCLETSSPKPLSFILIKDYIEQTNPIKAIMFTTKKDKLICANPEENWVKKAVQYLKRKAKRRTNLTEVTTAKEE